MAKVSKKGEGKTMYIQLSVFPCGNADPMKNLTISCPNKETRFKTTLSDNGLKNLENTSLSFIKRSFLIKDKNVKTPNNKLQRMAFESQRETHVHAQ